MPKTKKKTSSVIQCNIGLVPEMAERIDAIVREKQKKDPSANRSQVARDLIEIGLNAR